MSSCVSIYDPLTCETLIIWPNGKMRLVTDIEREEVRLIGLDELTINNPKEKQG